MASTHRLRLSRSTPVIARSPRGIVTSTFHAARQLSMAHEVSFHAAQQGAARRCANSETLGEAASKSANALHAVLAERRASLAARIRSTARQRRAPRIDDRVQSRATFAGQNPSSGIVPRALARAQDARRFPGAARHRGFNRINRRNHMHLHLRKIWPALLLLLAAPSLLG